MSHLVSPSDSVEAIAVLPATTDDPLADTCEIACDTTDMQQPLANVSEEGPHAEAAAQPESAPESVRDVTPQWFLKGQVYADGPMQRVPVRSIPFVVGRGASATLCLVHPTVSSRHAELFEAGGLMLLRDLGSRNGTFLNGQPVKETPRPLRHGDLVQFAELAFLVDCESQSETSVTMAGNTMGADVQESALGLVQFEKLMTEGALVPHFQPIVSLNNERPIGHELLGRSRLVGLQSAAAMFKAAAQFEREVELSRLLRRVGLEESGKLDAEDRPGDPLLFVNTHPLEVGSTSLLDSLRRLRRDNPERSIVLEIHEAAVADPFRLAELRAVLNDLGMGLAYDDFGAGQTRLRELVDVRPDYLKFDMGLIRDIDKADASKRHTLSSLVGIARDLGVEALAEGVETDGEHQACVDLGFTLGQGYRYGRPATVRELTK